MKTHKQGEGKMKHDVMEWIVSNPQMVGAIGIGCVALFIVMVVLLVMFENKADFNLKLYKAEEKSKLDGLRSDRAMVADFLGKFKDGQTIKNKIAEYLGLSKKEVENLQHMNNNQLDELEAKEKKLDKAINDYANMKSSHSSQGKALEEAKTEIKRLTGIAEGHYQDLEDMRRQRDSALEEAQDIDSELTNFKNQESPDYEGLEEKYNRQEIMVRKITSGRDNALNDVNRLQAYSSNLEDSMLKSKNKYQAKLDKLRKAIRGEGFTYELEGRKIKIYETE